MIDDTQKVTTSLLEPYGRLSSHSRSGQGIPSPVDVVWTAMGDIWTIADHRAITRGPFPITAVDTGKEWPFIER